MGDLAPNPATRWERLDTGAVADLLARASVRWWLAGGTAFDQWMGAPLRERTKSTVSTTVASIGQLVAALPAGVTAWVRDGEQLIAWADLPDDADYLAVRLFDVERGAWVLQVNVEDATEDRWVYRRDARLQLPWDRAVLDVGGLPTGAPEVQLVWKALRPKPEDEADKDIVLPALSEEARAWWERAILSIHPHSTWSIHVRSPLAPAKASWNRSTRRPGT
ncbi:hypothetical protein [Demequina sp.]|uniref:hypothetical protein n=1 Tax=Demequina sp. TaxID=2050685 RepID=UPI0025ECACFC|nr:hypothetical protein [Demequina sp.]